MASILVFGPHPDDQELGMGGTIIRLVKQGYAVHVVDMTTGEPTPLVKRRSGLPARLAQAIHRGLARKPEDRFPDVAAFGQALQAFTS